MATRINVSQLQSKLRQLANQRRQAVNKYNQAVRQHNQNVQRAVNTYNHEVAQYNARVRANRQRVVNELNKLNTRKSIRYEVLHTSTVTLNSRYQRLNSHEREFENLPFGNTFLDLSERENANSLAVANTIEAEEQGTHPVDGDLSVTTITNELSNISNELNDRWKGALFSLSPKNPDASRHFCTSAREIFVQILEFYAPDNAVTQNNPQCEMTEAGQPNRRSKIKFILMKAGIINDDAVEFVDENVKNILHLFRTFNEGTHGSAGKYEFGKLALIKERVESGISYLSKICTYSL